MSSVTNIMAGISTSITDFKANPNAVLKESAGEVVAVLKSNAPYFYAVPPSLFEAMFGALEDSALLLQAKARMNDGKEAIEVELNDL
jgi:antitoxin StbD